MDLNEFFIKYETLVDMVDNVFKKVKTEHVKNVKCKEGCSDCCYALFDLSLIEALYINHKFNEKISGNKKVDILENAGKVDRQIYKLKKDAYKEYKDGKKEVEILGKMAMERIRCPLLNSSDTCDLYENRPITCRLYGIPTSSGGVSHICGDSGFEQGVSYPTVNMDAIHKQLYDLSKEMSVNIKSKYTKLSEMLIPLSMALITEFTDEYLGVQEKKEDKDGE